MFLEEHFIMWLSRIEGLSIKKKSALLKYFGSAKEVFYSDKISLEDFNSKSKINFESIIEKQNENILNSYLDELYKKNIKFISINNYEYPTLLKEISEPPLGLYIIGEIPNDKLKKVAIIGSRKCTQYGANNAYQFSKDLAEENIVIVSGMALGIDSMAHKGSIDGRGKTIAVLGCGVDIIYPQSNSFLRNTIIENGCIISEFAPKTPPLPSNFPIINRIISGLSNAIIVVEAGKRSGTLITVNQALEQGRDVFAIPGNITSILSQGANELLKNGAHPLTEIDDVLFNIGISKKTNDNYNSTNTYEDLLPDEKIIYSYITSEPISIDEIIVKTNLKIQVVQYNLTMLELKGIIRKLAGQKYITL